MDEERRRSADKRLDKLEIVMQEMYSKINNGLSERTIRTEKSIDDLRVLMEEHLNNDRKEHAQMNHYLSEMDKNKQDKLTPMTWVTIWSFIIMIVIGSVSAFSITTTKLDALTVTVKESTKGRYYDHQAESEHKRLDEKIEHLDEKIDNIKK